MRTLWLLLVPAALVAGCASKERPPPAEGTTGSEGGAPTADASPADAAVALPVEAGSDPACQACNDTTCAAQFDVCSKDPACSTCFSAFAIGCFDSPTFKTTLDCACGGCRASCATACRQVDGLKCVVDQCPTEYAACSREPACNACFGTSPPAGCDKVATALAVAQCACDKCKSAGACGGP